MLKRFNTLAHRLTLGYASAFALFLWAAFAIAYFSFNTLLSSRLTEDLEEDLEELQMAYNDGGLEQVLADIDTELKTGDAEEIFFRISEDDREIFVSDANAWNDLGARLDALPMGQYPALYKIHLKVQDYPTQLIVGHLEEGGPLIYIGESTEQNAEILEVLLSLFVIMSILALPLAYAIGWWVSQRAVSGINAVSEAALDIEHGHLNRQVDIKGAGLEVQQLGQRFNAMSKRIYQLANEMREMIDNIAHDFRSPVTRIRAMSETLSRSDECKTGARQVIHECDQLIQLINTTLDVSEAEAGVIKAEMEAVELGELTHDVCELFEPAMEERQLQFLCDIQSASVYGFRAFLQRVIANLLDNAIKYTPKGGRISVSLSNGQDTAILVVEDTGIGIAEKDIGRIFDRFFRGDRTRLESGSGLGLSFCRAVVRAHKGSIQAASEVGKGSRFILTFPVANNLTVS